MISLSADSLLVIGFMLFLAVSSMVFMFFSRSSIADKKISKYRSSLFVCDIVTFLSLLYVDYFSKVRVRENMELGESFDLIPKVLQVCYFENTGAVWGILKGKSVFLLITTAIIMAICIYVFIKVPAERKYAAFHVALTLVLIGAVGNMIDRCIKQSVTDFIYVSLIDFPIFNVADICVVIGVFLLMFLFLFIYKDSDLDFLKPEFIKSEKSAENKAEK